MNKKVIVLVLVVFSFHHRVFSQNEPRIIVEVPTVQKPWNTIDWNNDSERFQFAIVTDRTGSHRPGIFMDGVNKLNLLQPEFVMSVGDLIEGYTTDTERLDAEWTEFNGFIDSLSMPFFYVPGNHDITNKVMEKKWQELFGVTYYHFVYNDVLFLCLNSEDNYRGAGRGTIDDEQYEYIKQVLEENQDVRWTLLFMHQPLWVQEDTKRWKDVEALLKDRNHNVFAGHYHRYWKAERNNGKYIALATTGGGSRLRGTAYGEFDHVVWVTMTEEGPLLANLLLEGIWDEDVVNEEIVELVREKPFPIRIEPLYLTDKMERKSATEIKVTNTSDFKMSVNIEGLVHPEVFYTLDKQEFEVEPNDVVTFNLSLKNPEGMDMTRMDPVVLKTEISYDYDKRPDLVLRNILRFAPNYKHEVSKTSKKVKVDGNLKEWDGEWITLDPKNMKGSPFYFNGENDCSIKFSKAYDDDNFYLAFEITDDEIYKSEDASHWNQDVLVVGIDARTEYISAMNDGEGRGRDWIAYLRTFNDKDPVFNGDKMPEGMISEVERTEKGYTVEMAVPVKMMNQIQKDEWSTVRIGVGYYDYDKNGEERNEIFWYPAWNTPENIPGSGMLFKSEGLANN